MLQAWGYAVDADSSLDAACARIENGRATIDAVLCATGPARRGLSPRRAM